MPRITDPQLGSWRNQWNESHGMADICRRNKEIIQAANWQEKAQLECFMYFILVIDHSIERGILDIIGLPDNSAKDKVGPENA